MRPENAGRTRYNGLNLSQDILNTFDSDNPLRLTSEVLHELIDLTRRPRPHSETVIPARDAFVAEFLCEAALRSYEQSDEGESRTIHISDEVTEQLAEYAKDYLHESDQDVSATKLRLLGLTGDLDDLTDLSSQAQAYIESTNPAIRAAYSQALNYISQRVASDNEAA
jgi:hypothetical protein